MVVTIHSKKSKKKIKKKKKEKELVEKQYERQKSRIKEEGVLVFLVIVVLRLGTPSLRMGKIPSQDRPSVHFFR